MRAEPERLGAREFFDHPLAAAVMAVVGERGYEAASIEEICAAAGVQRAEFDRLFPDKAAAMLRTFEAYIEDFETLVAAAYNSASAWPASLREAAYALARWLEENPLAPRFGMVEVSDAEEMARVRREGVLRWCARLIDGGREVAVDPAAVSEGTSLIAVGSVAQIVTREATHPDGVLPLIPELMYTAVRPYLGEEAAKRELSIPPPPPVGPRGGA